MAPEPRCISSTLRNAALHLRLEACAVACLPNGSTPRQQPKRRLLEHTCGPEMRGCCVTFMFKHGAWCYVIWADVLNYVNQVQTIFDWLVCIGKGAKHLMFHKSFKIGMSLTCIKAECSTRIGAECSTQMRYSKQVS